MKKNIKRSDLAGLKSQASLTAFMDLESQRLARQIAALERQKASLEKLLKELDDKEDADHDGNL